MKQTIFALLLGFACMGSAWADHAGVSISVGQPGFFGQIDLGNLAPPPVIRESPIIIKRSQHRGFQAPIYLRVPPSHQRNWGRYCSRYNACNRPVYFVKDDWYSNEYAPRYREQHQENRHDH